MSGMVIRPIVRRDFVALPNAILNDRRLSADTRAMLAHILSKPRAWEIRPRALAKALSGPIPLGQKRLGRMFREASAAGYMIRSKTQEHKDEGSFGRYAYYVGMPEDIAHAAKVTKEHGITTINELGVSFLPQRPEAYTPEACTRDGRAIHKRESLQNTESRKPPLPPNAQRAARPNGLAKKRLIEGQEVIHHRVAQRIGQGDVALGVEIFLALPASRQDELTASERAGKLTDDTLARVWDEVRTLMNSKDGVKCGRWNQRVQKAGLAANSSSGAYPLLGMRRTQGDRE
jgi:hypothetical protein